MKQAIFKDNQLNQHFEEKGYVKIPFLNDGELNKLQLVFDEISESQFNTKGVEYLQFGTLTESQEMKTYQDEVVQQAFDRSVNEHISHYKHTVGMYIVKAIGGAAFGPHQNQTYVEESKFDSLVVWVPLQDIDDQGGTLHVVEGSHATFDFMKYRDRQAAHFDNLRQYLLDNHLISIPCKKGEAIIFNDRLIHYSSANTSNVPRVVAAAFMRPESSTLYHYEPDKQNQQMQEFKIVDESIATSVESSPEMLEFLRSFPVDFSKFSRLKFDYFHKGYDNLNLINRMKCKILGVKK